MKDLNKELNHAYLAIFVLVSTIISLVIMLFERDDTIVYQRAMIETLNKEVYGGNPQAGITRASFVTDSTGVQF